MASSRRLRGFTLLEMLVVMVLLGLVTSLALPAMQRWHDAVQLRAEAGLVVDVLQAAAFQAAAARQDMRVDAESFTQLPASVGAAASASERLPQYEDNGGTAADAAARSTGLPAAPRDRVAVTLGRGWSVSDVAPARFLASGLCVAGGFTLQPPAGTPVMVKVEGPVCKVALQKTADAR